VAGQKIELFAGERELDSGNHSVGVGPANPRQPRLG
jgi:hypothetical protein